MAELWQLEQDKQQAAMRAHVRTMSHIGTYEEHFARELTKIQAARIEKKAQVEAQTAFEEARVRGMAKAIAANAKGETVTAPALVSRNLASWPTAEKDLKEASRNGLKAAAHTGTKNRWHEGAALQWAAGQNKLVNRSMATLPGRVFSQK